MAVIKFENAQTGPLRAGYKGCDWAGFQVFSAEEHPEWAAGITSGDHAIIGSDISTTFTSEHGSFSITSLNLTTPGWLTANYEVLGLLNGQPEVYKVVAASESPTNVYLGWTDIDEIEVYRSNGGHRDPNVPHMGKIVVIDDILFSGFPPSGEPVVHAQSHLPQLHELLGAVHPIA